ncbi:replicative DNA helicase [Labrys sp. ZIDIC5]|uniref:replicative DNA helicase n=1 Tax=Labrys sedimenti TaxID=3106036 RepID=UPI002ACA740D|nr:DnaB-like helicase C-terminal domain-containing protein [Labrys sp. ZIDIC5]MDZ5448915.1 DnaB-like helicase C-terminal domain-containing protein [Labrys sp. ZIDIC5]
MNAMAPLPPRPIASVEAEQAMLGAIMLNNEAYGAVADVVKPEDFYEPLHRTIFDLIGRQIRDGVKVDAITLRQALPDVEVAPGIRTQQYLIRLAAEATTVIGAKDYARAVRQAFVARQIAAVGEELRAAPDNAKTTSEALDEAWKRLDKLREDTQESEDKSATVGEAAQKVAQRITEIRAGKSESVVSTGLAEYDKAIGGGFRSGRLYVQAGRPGQGKTVLALAQARRIARAGHGVMFFSLEIDDEETAARVIAADLARSSSPLSYRDILTGQVDDHNHERVSEAALRMQEWPLRFDCTGGISMAQIAARARLQKERLAKIGKELKVVFIDYLGLLKVTDRYKGNATIEQGELALAGKTLSKELGVAMVMLAQLNRGVEGREDKRPTMADLRQSGNIEEHADCVGLLYRPAYYLEKTAKYKADDPDALDEMLRIKNDFELIIDKNRLGPTGTRHFWCEVSLNSVEDKTRY